MLSFDPVQRRLHPTHSDVLGFQDSPTSRAHFGRYFFYRRTLAPLTFYWSWLHGNEEFGEVDLGDREGGIGRDSEGGALAD